MSSCLVRWRGATISWPIRRFWSWGVEPGGPAAAARLAEGDLIFEFGGRSIGSIDDLHAVLTHDRIGMAWPIRVLRDGDVREFQIMPAEKG